MCSGGLGVGVVSGALRRVEGLGSLGLLWGVMGCNLVLLVGL